MRFKPVIIWVIVAFMTVQQTIIFGAVMRRDNTTTILSHAGSVYMDARQNTRVLRVTDENDARSANVISTTTFNHDATHFVVNLDGVATLYRFNAAAFNTLKEGPLFDRESLDSDSLQWSAADANTIFGLDTSDGTARIAAYDTVTRRSQIVKDFSAVLGRGEAHRLSKSPTADNRFAFAWRDAGASAWRAVIVWDATTDNVYSFDLNDPAAGVADFINADFNQSGEALVVNGATTRIWRFMAESQIESVQLAPVSEAMVAQSASRDVLSRADEMVNTMPRQEVSHDGRFTLYSAGSSGSRQDVFIAAVAPSAGASSMAWANLVNCSADGNTVQKTGGSNSSDDATATSLDSITEGDAYVEFTAVDTDKERVCGLSNSNAVHVSTNDINFGLRLTSARKAMIIENGVTKGKVKYKPGNVFRVAVESGAVHYYKNGGLIYTSSARPAYPMLVTASLVNTMAAINDATVFGGTATAVVSINPSRTTLTTGQTAQFSAVITSAQIKGLTWSASGGTITSTGLYTAPATAGSYTVTATLLSSPTMTATAAVTVTSGADTTPPVISAVASSGLTASGATINWTTDEASDSTVEYGKTTTYGASAMNAAKVTSHSLILSGLSAGTTYHYHVKSRDAAGNLTTSGDFTFATTAAGGGTTAAPVISVLSTGSVTTSGAAITWTTDKTSDSQVEYGTSASYGSSTTLASAMVTNHSATLTGLASGAMYHFRVKSRDSGGNLVTSGDQAFVTAAPAGGGTASSGSTSGTDPLKTDKNVYPEPAPPALPAAGGTLVDPTFGTTIMRVTDERDGTSNYNSYSYWPSLNRNNSRLVVFVNDGDPTLYDFDPVNFRISNKRALFRATLPGGGYPWNDDVNWSGSDPDVIFCHSGMKIYSYNVVSNVYTLIHDFSGQAPGANLFQMSKSIDDNAFGCTLKDANWNVVGYMAYQRTQNNLYYVQTTEVDEVQIDKSGLYLTILTGDQGTASAIESKIVNLQTRSVANITDGAPDFSPGHHDSGSNLVVGNDNWNNALNARQLSNPHQFYNVLNMGNDWSQSNHVSLLDDGDSWLLVSFFVATSLPNSGLYKNELVLVATDGSQRVRRVAHHHSVYRDYWDTPRADISRDGQFAIFTSNWGSSSRRDVFIVKIPPATGGSTGGGGDTTPPVVSAIAASNVTAASATVNWASNESSDTQIDYGTTASYGSSTTLSSTRVTTHSAALSSLSAGTVYHYRVKSRDAAGNLAVSSDLVLTTLGAVSGGTGGGGTGGGGTGGGGTGGTGVRQNVVWTGIVNCTATGNNLQKTAGQTDGADAGARSQQSLASGDGYLEFTANETNMLRFCGLTRTVSGTDFAGIDYAIKLTDYAVAEVREANVYKGETPYKTGDVFRVAVEGGVVKYYKNGTVFYTSSRAVSYPLIVDASFVALNSTIGNAVITATTGTLATSIAPQPLSFGATTLAVVSAPANAVAPVTGLMNADPMNKGVREEMTAAAPFTVADVIASPVSLFGLRSGNAGWWMFASNGS